MGCQQCLLHGVVQLTHLLDRIEQVAHRVLPGVRDEDCRRRHERAALDVCCVEALKASGERSMRAHGERLDHILGDFRRAGVGPNDRLEFQAEGAEAL